MKFINSFRYAFEGLWHCLRYGRSFKIHIAAAVIVIGAAICFRVSTVSMSLLLIAVAMVLAAEMLNTAIEKAVDIVTDKPHPLAKTAKDVAAGAVLVTAVFAALIGILVVIMEVNA